MVKKVGKDKAKAKPKSALKIKKATLRDLQVKKAGDVKGGDEGTAYQGCASSPFTCNYQCPTEVC